MRRLLIAAGALALPAAAHAQNLGPFRQFLAVEPYYAFVVPDIDEADDASTVEGLHGLGARLWINTAPFGLTDRLGVGLFATYTPNQRSQGVTVLHYGGQLELFPVHRPFGGVIDPFVTVGAGAFRLNTFGGQSGITREPVTRLSLVPGAGIRIPIPNRFQLRAEVRDAIVMRSDQGSMGSATRTAHNLEVKAALGLTF